MFHGRVRERKAEREMEKEGKRKRKGNNIKENKRKPGRKINTLGRKLKK